MVNEKKIKNKKIRTKLKKKSNIYQIGIDGRN